MSLSRRTFLMGTAVTGVAAAMPFAWADRVRSDSGTRMPSSKLPKPFTVPFARPPASVPFRTTTTTDFHLIRMAATSLEILPGFQTDLWAYNGSVPGPTIRAQRGRQVVARFANHLPGIHPVLGYEAYTSIHLHGAASQPEYDGYASDITHPGQLKDYKYRNVENSRSLWYHDHAVHHTWTNVYMGLAGQYFIIDPADARFGLPTGEYDVPLHLSDALFQADGQLFLTPDDTKGIWGDVMLVNGRPWPAMPVKRRKYRFRLVNGCVSRSLFWRLSTNDPFQVISTDDGLVPTPITVNKVRHVNGERYDIVVDFAKYPAGTRVMLMNDSLPYNQDYTNTNKIMAFDVTDEPFDPTNNDVPAELATDNPVMTLAAPKGAKVRTFQTVRQGGEWTVNGHTWNDVIASRYQLVAASPAVGATEIWELRNESGGWIHPFHIHGVDGRLLSRNGAPPYPYEAGPKDTYWMGPGHTLRVLMKFELPGKYMMHCHNGVHEDHDMMVQYETVDPANEEDPFSAPCEDDVGQPL
ncbi:MAG: hypothetical protein RJA49_550 [Actinomycetota bacterium]